MTNTSFFSILMPFTNNKWFNPPWSWYLINLATLLFTKFEIFRHPSICQCLVWNVLEHPYLIVKYFSFTNSIRYLLKDRQYFTPWLGHIHVNKELLQWFCRFLYFRGHVNVEINKLDLLKQFKIQMKFFHPHLFFLTENKWFDPNAPSHPMWGSFLINLATLVSTIFEISKHQIFAQCLIWNVL